MQAHRALVIMMVAKSPLMMVLLVPGLPVLFVILKALPYCRNFVKAMERRAGDFIQLEADAI